MTIPPDVPPLARQDRRSWKFLQIVLLLLATLVGCAPISSIIDEREDRQDGVRQELARSWGPEQALRTPILAVPYRAAGGKVGYLRIAPAALATQATLNPERRKRGLFSAVVYTAAVEMTGTFTVPSPASLNALLGPDAYVFWEDGLVLLQLSSPVGMTATDRLVWNGETIPWRGCEEMIAHAEDCNGVALVAHPALAARPAADTEMAFQATVTLRGTGVFQQRLDSRQAKAAIKAPWATPSFTGTVLPSDFAVTAGAFDARWDVVDYAKPLLRSSTVLVETLEPARPSSIGVELLEAVPAYRMIKRTSKYALLFTVLSFTVYALFERLAAVRIHIVQYGLLGLSMTLFALLLLSFAEPLGYAAGYWVSAALVLLQATAYTGAVTRRARPTLVFAAALFGQFGCIYLVLGLETYALLVGTVGLFLVLSGIMAVTQRVDWRAEGA